jgi:hypothetical protein
MESTGITPLMHTVTVSPTGPVSLEVTLPGTGLPARACSSPTASSTRGPGPVANAALTSRAR